MDFEDSCKPSSYYQNGKPTGTHASCHNLLKLTHARVIPYTSSSKTDVWDGMKVLDEDGAGKVRLIYRNIAMSDELQGKTDGYNREHLWPKSYGVGYTGADFSDLHHLRPADWGVNAARGNKLFGECLDGLSDDCNTPANNECPADTTSDKERWLPPAEWRGDIARAMFYMDTRYDGDDGPDGIDLVLSDCPDKSGGRLGYLSQLLKWHAEDPVDARERERNDKVCEIYQGNRNVFVDYPELVDEIFGTDIKEYTDMTCEGDGGDGDDGGEGEGEDPVEPVHSVGACNGIAPGDLMFLAFNSKGTDSFLMVALKDLPQFSTIYVSDDAWTGFTFYKNEGIISLTVPEGGLTKGTVFGFGAGSLKDVWSNVEGSFALTESGETILSFCHPTDQKTGETNPSKFQFISGASYSKTGWATREQGNDVEEFDFGTTDSSCPIEIDGIAAVTLPYLKNYWYIGPTQGTKADLVGSVMESTNWVGSNTQGYDEVITSTDFQVMEDGWEVDVDKEAIFGLDVTDLMMIGVGVSLFFVSLCVCCLIYNKDNILSRERKLSGDKPTNFETELNRLKIRGRTKGGGQKKATISQMAGKYGMGAGKKSIAGQMGGKRFMKEGLV